MNWKLNFFNGDAVLAIESFQSDLCGRTRTVQVKSVMCIDSHLEGCVLVRTA